MKICVKSLQQYFGIPAYRVLTYVGLFAQDAEVVLQLLFQTKQLLLHFCKALYNKGNTKPKNPV